MLGPQALPASYQAIQDLTRKFGTEIAELQALRWKMLGLYTRNRGDIAAGLGLLHAYEMLGDRAEAGHLADDLWGRRFGLELNDRATLAILQASIGEYARAADLVDIDTRGVDPYFPMLQETLRTEAALSVWNTGDILALRRRVPGLDPLFSALESAGLLACMPERQALVNGVLVPLQCTSQFYLGHDDDISMTAIRTVYIAGDYRSCRDVSEHVADLLAEFYLERGIDTGSAMACVGEIVLPVEARYPADEAAAVVAL